MGAEHDEHDEHDEHEESSGDAVSKAGDAFGAAGDIAKGAKQKGFGFGGPKLIGSGLGLVGGIVDMIHGHVVDGGIKTAKSGVDAADAALGVMGKESEYLGPVGAALDFMAAYRKWQAGDHPGAVIDGIGGGLSAASAPVGAAWKAGTMIGDAANQDAAKSNMFGGNRTASAAATDAGLAAQEEWENMGLNATAARFHGADVALGDSAIDAVRATSEEFLPPALRQYLSDARNGVLTPVDAPIDTHEEPAQPQQEVAYLPPAPKRNATPAEVAKLMKQLKSFQAANAKVVAQINRAYKGDAKPAAQTSAATPAHAAAQPFDHYAD